MPLSSQAVSYLSKIICTWKVIASCTLVVLSFWIPKDLRRLRNGAYLPLCRNHCNTLSYRTNIITGSSVVSPDEEIVQTIYFWSTHRPWQAKFPVTEHTKRSIPNILFLYRMSLNKRQKTHSCTNNLHFFSVL